MTSEPRPAGFPLLSPWIGQTEEGPALFYADADGRTVILPVDDVALARLALSVAEAQARRAMIRLDQLAGLRP